MKPFIVFAILSIATSLTGNCLSTEAASFLNEKNRDFDIQNQYRDETPKKQEVSFTFFDGHITHIEVPIGESVVNYLPNNTETINDGYYEKYYSWKEVDALSFVEEEKTISVSSDYTFTFYSGDSILVKVPQNGDLNDYLPENTVSSFTDTIETYYLWDFDSSNNKFIEMSFERQYALQYAFTYINGVSEDIFLPYGENIKDYLPSNTISLNDGYTQTDYLWIPTSRYSFTEVGSNLTVSTTYTFKFNNGSTTQVTVPQNGNVEDYYPTNTPTTNDGYTETTYTWILSDGLNYTEKVTKTTVSTTYTFVFINGTSQNVVVPQNGNVEDYYPANTADVVSDCVRHIYTWSLDTGNTFIEVDSPIDIMIINYVLNDGINSENNLLELHSGDSFVLEPASKEGYEFNGWYEDSGFNDQITEISFSKGEKTIYAKFTIIHYSITYHLDGGTNALKNPSSYTIDDSLELKSATKAGHHFDGWFTDETFTNKITILGGQSGDLDLYARFSPEQYHATFNLTNGTSLDSSMNIKMDYQIIGKEPVVTALSYSSAAYKPYANTDFSNEGFVFAGWYLDRELTDQFDEDLVVTGDISLYAKWNQNNTEYVSFAKGLTGKYSTKYVIPYGVTKVTFQFKTNGYSNKKCYVVNETTGTTTSATSSSSTTYTYVYANVSTNDVIEVYSSGNYNFTAYGYTGLAHSIKTYYVKEQSDFRNVIDTYYEYGNGGALPTPYTSKSGYNFVAWQDSDGNLYHYYSELPIGGVDLEPYYEPISYNITYNLNGGTQNPLNETTYSIEKEVTLYAPSRPGYDFLGWTLYSTGTNYINKVNWQTRYGGAVSVYANWKLHDYTVNLNLNGGRICSEFEFVSDVVESKHIIADETQTIEYYIPSERDGYIFGGWERFDGELYDFSGTLPCVLNNTLNTNSKNYVFDRWLSYDSNAVRTHLGSSIAISIEDTNYQYFAFVPLETQEITLKTSGDFDSYGALFDASFNEICSNDDRSDSDLNFELTATVQAGTLYYLGVRGNQTTAPISGTLDIGGSYIPNSTLIGQTSSSNSFTINYQSTLVLPTPIREGYDFDGWEDQDGNVYNANYTYTFTQLKDLVLSARWVSA